MEHRVILCGLGRVGGRILDHLRASGHAVHVVSLDAMPEGWPEGVGYTAGDCRRPEVLAKAGIATATGVIIVTSDDMVNITTAFAVRQLTPTARIVVRMFNQNLLPRLGAVVKNAVALSVSSLTAPLLALTALTGDSLGAFQLDAGAQQVAAITVDAGSDLVGRRIGDLAAQYKLLVVAWTPAGEADRLWTSIPGDGCLGVGDSLIVCGAPATLAPLLSSGRGELLSGVRWAGWLRRQFRAVRRTFASIDFALKLAAGTLFAVIAASTAVFYFAEGKALPDAFYNTVSIIATGGELHGEDRATWVRVYLSGLKLSGAALVAAFTAIFTQYLIRAKLGGALEVRRIPDSGHVVVCGLGNVGFRCVTELVRLGTPVVAIDKVNDNPFAATVRRMGIPVIVGDCTVPVVLRQANAHTARATLAVTDHELANLEVALLVREMAPAERVVVRLNDPLFAAAVRESADIRHAVSVPALAAPAFAAALLGDRVQTLVTVAGRTLAVVDLIVQPHDPCLFEKSLIAAMIDYGFLPVAVGGAEPFTTAGLPRSKRLNAGDRLTVFAELPTLERLLRREAAPAGWRVEIDSYPVPTTEALIPIVRTNRGCTQEEAVKLVSVVPLMLADRLTRGEAEELLARLTRDKVTGRIEAMA